MIIIEPWALALALWLTLLLGGAIGVFVASVFRLTLKRSTHGSNQALQPDSDDADDRREFYETPEQTSIRKRIERDRRDPFRVLSRGELERFQRRVDALNREANRPQPPAAQGAAREGPQPGNITTPVDYERRDPQEIKAAMRFMDEAWPNPIANRKPKP